MDPTPGCTQVSSGCDHCYALTLVNTRMVVNPKSVRFGHPFDEVMLHENRFDIPRKLKKPSRIFVNSMSDLFHRDIPDTHIGGVFDVMETVPRHTYQLLTKRSERMGRYVRQRYGQHKPPGHIWLGVSIEINKYASRAEDLRDTPAAIRFLSIEPMLGPIDKVDLSGIDWVIVGGESGSGARPMDIAWAREVRDRCTGAGIAFFLKQLGGAGNKRGHERAVLDGRRWIEYPK